MSGFDFDAMRDWEFSFNGFRRKTPVYMPDREALDGVLKRFEEISTVPRQDLGGVKQAVPWQVEDAYEAKALQFGPHWHLTLMIDGERVPWGSAEDVMKAAPRLPTRLELSSPSANVELSTAKGGETAVRTYASGYSGFDSQKLQELVRALHRYAAPIPWYRRRLYRLGVRPLPVATRKDRDKVDDRREGRRLNRVSAGWGFVGGLVGAIATVVAAWLALVSTR